MKPSDIDRIFRMMDDLMNKGYSGGYTNYEDISYQEEENPLVDISEDNNNVYITIELMGIDKDDVKVIVEPENLVLEVLLNNKIHKKSFRLPYPVKTKGNKINFNNGILDVILKKDNKYERKEITSNRIRRNTTCSRSPY